MTPIRAITGEKQILAKIDRGISFCQVSMINIMFIERALEILISQKCKGAIPSLVASEIAIKVGMVNWLSNKKLVVFSLAPKKLIKTPTDAIDCTKK